MRRFSSLMAGLFLFFAAAPSHAVPPLNPKTYPHPPKDHIHVPSARQVRAAGSLKAATIAVSTGTKHVAVIMVGFNTSGCSGCTSGQRTIQSLATIQTYFTSMAAYYDQVSYHKVAMEFSYFGPNASTATAAAAGAFTFNGAGGLPNHPMEYYGCGDEGPGGSGSGCSGVTTPLTGGVNGNYLIRDAIDAARNAGHVELVSTDNGGIYDEVIVVHAGNGNETTATDGDIWSIFYSQDAGVIGGLNPVDVVAAAAGFSEGDVVPETESSGIVSPLGVMCHEFGHSLGLPDLYNTIFGSSVVGRWEIMDLGPYDGIPTVNAGAKPAHMGVWDKITLGWLTPTVSAAKQNVTLSAIETNQSALKIQVQNGSAQEYFLVEYRLHTSDPNFDAFIPGDGLIIWHIDDAITSARGINASNPSVQNTVNSGSPYYGVSIVTRDGIPVSANQGDAGNAYGPGSSFTSPASNNFAGKASGISIVNIVAAGSNMLSFQVANLATTADQSITKLINYPNPAGKGYTHPSGEGHTTLQMQLTRPANDCSFNIYTLSGDLVRKIGMSEITLNLDRSTDDKWVYEYIWDLKNGDGSMVAPGVYLYLSRADGKSKSNKAVIIR